MLDSGLLEKLKELFADLPCTLTLAIRPSLNERQSELLELARQLASTSGSIQVQLVGEPVQGGHLALLRDGSPTGVSFRGVPGGHEFSSLVLAMLNAAGKGKLPDEQLTSRIRALKAGAKVRTYVSLECTNCPEVVQSLNLISLLHPEFQHQMVDGALFPEEIERLGIKAVPAVFLGDELVHSGRAVLLELLAMLEVKVGTESSPATKNAPTREYDVVVIGGGPAGASSAIYSARKGLRTAIVADRLGGQVRETVGIENLIGNTYTEGKRLAADLERHLRAYPIELLENRRVSSVSTGERKELVLESGERLLAGAVIVATGAKWRELEIPGERKYLGRGVAFCPHCDGPFYKGKRVAVVGGGNSGVEAAIDLSGIVEHVTLLEYSNALRADDVLVQKLRSRSNVSIITSARTSRILGDGAKVTGLEYEDREKGTVQSLELDGVFVQIGLVPNSGFLGDLVERNSRGEVIVDEKGRTSVPGIYAAGDVTTVPFKQIVIAMGEGAKVALTVFEDAALGS